MLCLVCGREDEEPEHKDRTQASVRKAHTHADGMNENAIEENKKSFNFQSIIKVVIKRNFSFFSFNLARKKNKRRAAEKDNLIASIVI